MNYETELNENTHKLCMNTLVNLPFVMTEENTEPNMITIRRKDGIRDYEFQIWRNSDEEYGFTHSFLGQINPKTFNLNGTKYVNTNDYLIDLTYGCDFVLPVAWQ